MLYHTIDQASCLLTEDGGLAVDYVGRVEALDEDVTQVLAAINDRIPFGECAEHGLSRGSGRVLLDAGALAGAAAWNGRTMPTIRPQQAYRLAALGLQGSLRPNQRPQPTAPLRAGANVAPLRLPASVAAVNTGPEGALNSTLVRQEAPPGNDKYLPAYEGDSAQCFGSISSLYRKDVEVLYPRLWQRLPSGLAGTA